MTSIAETAGVRILRGKCLCGTVQFEVEDRFGYALNCHCSNCRRTTGAAFKPFAGIEREKFKITCGAGWLLIYGEQSGHDAHCGQCGLLLYSLVQEAKIAHVALGTLVDSPSIRPTAPASLILGSITCRSRLTPHQRAKYQRECDYESAHHPAMIEPKCVDPRSLRVRSRVGDRYGIARCKSHHRLLRRIDDAVQSAVSILELKDWIDLLALRALEVDDGTLNIGGLGRRALVVAVEHHAGEKKYRCERER